MPPWWQKTSEVSSPRFVQAQCLVFSLSFLFPSLVSGKAWFSTVGLVRVQRAWPLDSRNGRELLRRLSRDSEACFLTREAVIQPLRSAWEDDTCLGLQSEGTRYRK